MSWVAGGGAAEYQVFRRLAEQDAEWELIGSTEETRYLDAPLPDYRMFFYRVRSVNAAGESAWSNIDSGFAGGGEDPFVIRVQIDMAGTPVPGVPVGLVGYGEEMLSVTNGNGIAWFTDLAPGRYIVAPDHAELDFFPRYQIVECIDQHLNEIHFNCAPSEVFHRAWGFAVTKAPEESEYANDFLPLAGVTVGAVNVDDEELVLATVTDENGFYLIEDIPGGIYLLGAELEGFEFFPPVHELVVNGHNRPDRHDFIGFPQGSGEGSEPE